MRDEGGNITVLSPHAFTLFEKPDEMAWSYFSKNPYIGKMINVDMFGAIQAIEELTGKQFIYVAELPEDQKENKADQIREAEIIERMKDDVEIDKEDAIEWVENTKEIKSAKTTTEYNLDPVTGKIMATEVRQNETVGTGVSTARTVEGTWIDNKSGKCYRKKTREEATEEIDHTTDR